MNFVRTEGFMSIVKLRSLISNSAGMHRLMMRKGNFPCDKNLWLQYNDLRVKVCAICEMMKGQRGLIRFEKTQGVSKWQNNFHDEITFCIQTVLKLFDYLRYEICLIYDEALRFCSMGSCLRKTVVYVGVS